MANPTKSPAKRRGPGRPATGRTGVPVKLYLSAELVAEAKVLALVRDNLTGPSKLMEKLLRAEIAAVMAGRGDDPFSVEARAAILRHRKAARVRAPKLKEAA